jgi:hypothetical protein
MLASITLGAEADSYNEAVFTFEIMALAARFS